MKIYINYSDTKFIQQQKVALSWARYFGGFDKVVGYGKSDIDRSFYEKYKNILSQKKGGGYWLWKPYLISKTMESMTDGDYLFYSDSGAYFIRSVDLLIRELNKYNQDIMGYELPLIEAQWSKKELFINMECDNRASYESNQLLASFILFKKTKKSDEFVSEYLHYAGNEINITDKYNELVTQDSDFIEHRHDQSIFSLLYKKYNLRPFKDPSQFGSYPIGYSGCWSSKIQYSAGKLYELKNGINYRYYDYRESYKNVVFHFRSGGFIKILIKFAVKAFLFDTKRIMRKIMQEGK